jgi:hypothetical protein
MAAPIKGPIPNRLIRPRSIRRRKEGLRYGGRPLRGGLRLVLFVQFFIRMSVDPRLRYEGLNGVVRGSRFAPELRDQRRADQDQAAYDQCDSQNVHFDARHQRQIDVGPVSV